MKILSFVFQNHRWQQVQVHIQFLPGLPGISMIGLPDRTLKESTLRIKAALHSQNFELPVAHQVVIDLKPALLPKSNSGLELAIACGILWKSGQQKPPFDLNSLVIYGDVGVDGLITMPKELCDEIPLEPSQTLLTGVSAHKAFPWPSFRVRELGRLEHMEFLPAQPTVRSWVRPQLADIRLTPKMAEFVKIVALGEHSALVAGPPGTGKTTAVQNMSPLLTEPDVAKLYQAKEYGVAMPNWRPQVSPHHSTPTAGVIGGGQPVRPGALTRAHGGVLILDEFFEFHPQIQESLREPLEQGVIHLFRGVSFETLPAGVLLLATTNLCDCGSWLPLRLRHPDLPQCRCRSTRLAQFHQRVRGPSLDRFHILYYACEKPGRAVHTISLHEIFKELERARQFSISDSSRLSIDSASDSGVFRSPPALTSMALELWEKEVPTIRRRLSWLKVARTIADLEQASQIDLSHLRAAYAWTVEPFLDWF
jgi:magnesium chelatase family protein